MALKCTDRWHDRTFTATELFECSDLFPGIVYYTYFSHLCESVKYIYLLYCIHDLQEAVVILIINTSHFNVIIMQAVNQ